jgi:D-alanyl-lipoteichoic acid acyltransferase DltB (MBOAT superfamily)
MQAGVLFFFKYYNFFNDSIRYVFDRFSVGYTLPGIELLLPVGISFYTFRTMSYTIDVYRGKLQPERRLGRLALYVSFFPQLVSGPIERAGNLLPQFDKQYGFDYGRVTNGLKLMAWGMFKKVAIADRLAVFVDQVYRNPTAYDGVPLILATVFFAFQVYCDFSGYSDIAIGAGQVMGFRLAENFNRPYFSRSIPEFWHRWHITLLAWLRDYVYDSMCRSPLIRLKWNYKFLLSLFITFLISGIWHGASWTCIAFGALHGIYMVVSVAGQKLRRAVVTSLGLDKLETLHKSLQILTTFSLVCISYVFFRSQSLSDAVYIVTHFFSGLADFPGRLGDVSLLRRDLLLGQDGLTFVIAVGMICLVVGVQLLQSRGSVRELLALRPMWLRWTAYYALIMGMIVFGNLATGSRDFIYFQF